jgi:hypothetical protein
MKNRMIQKSCNAVQIKLKTLKYNLYFTDYASQL